MFGSRGDYLPFFELTIPEALYLDWHRCFVFHRLALAAIRADLGSLVWLGDQRIQTVANSSIDRSNVDLDRGEMSFNIFSFDGRIDTIIASKASPFDKMEELAALVGEAAFPDYLQQYVKRTSPLGARSIALHPSLDISGYKDASGLEKAKVVRKRGFLGKSQLDPSKFPSVLHHLIVIHDGRKNARVFYKFVGSIQFLKNMAHDSGV